MLRLVLSLATVVLAASIVACGSDSPGESTESGGAASGGATTGGGGSPGAGGATGGAAGSTASQGGAVSGGSATGGATGGRATGGDGPATGGASGGAPPTDGGSGGAVPTGGSGPSGGTGGVGPTGGVGGSEPSGGAGGDDPTGGSGGDPSGGSGGDGPSGGAGGALTGGAGSGGSGEGGVVPGGPRWLGRVDASDPDAVRFAWQGAGVIATVSGSEIAVTLRTEGTDTVFFQPVIDGVEAERFEVRSGGDETVTLATALPATDHVVELLRDTEGMYGVSTFLGFTSGTVIGAPAPSGRLVEVVGDSISAGYGNLGSEPHPNWVATPACHWTAENSSYYLTYAAIAGRALDAEVSTLARSGWGICRDADGDPSGVLPAVYDHAVGTDDAAPWGFVPEASAVVINLGTNDMAPGDPGDAYGTALLAFLEEVRSRYPGAWIVLAAGSMLGDAERGVILGYLASVRDARAAGGDERVSVLDLGAQDMGADGSVPTGCDWHPNVADHERMAALLEAELRDRLGW